MTRFLNVLLLTLTTITLLGCGQKTSKPSQENKTTKHGHTHHAIKPYQGEGPIKVVCTLGQIGDMLRHVGGEHLKVTTMMGPGVDPHLYKALTSDIEKLEAADLIVYCGLHLEGRLTDTFVSMSRRKSIIAITHQLESSQDVRLRKPSDFEGSYDPHVWHDVALWSDCVGYLVEELVQLDPKHATTYQANGKAYRAKLAKLHQFCKTEIAKIPTNQRVLVTAHDAFGYFSLAYDLETKALKGTSTEEDVDLGQMQRIVELVVKKKIKAVFVESAVAPKIIEALIEPCLAHGHRVTIGGELYADTLGPKEKGADTYIGMIRANIKTIVEALAKE